MAEVDLSGQRLPICEEFYSIQGEGVNAGNAAYFIRLAGCDVNCKWCDTKQSWNVDNATVCNVEDIAKRALSSSAQNVVITGGEPLMYNLEPLCQQLERYCLSVWLETSGTHYLSGSFDWICVSPKSFKPPLDEVLEQAHELKVVISSPEDFDFAQQCASKVAAECVLTMQPEWSARETIAPLILDYVLKHPIWKMTVQMHKYLNFK